MRDNIMRLEPVLHVEVRLPSEFLGPVTADLNARRGEIQKLHSRGSASVLEALVPAAKMFDYADEVRSLSQERASPSLEPHSYRPAGAGGAGGDAPPGVLRALPHAASGGACPRRRDAIRTAGAEPGGSRRRPRPA